jgi:putative MATE family efflux protein
VKYRLTSQQDQSKSSLVEGPVALALARFALPMLVGNILQTVSMSINAAWVGHFIGAAALAATANAGSLLFLALSVTLGISIAASIYTGQAVGSSDRQRALHIAGNGLACQFAVSVAFACVGIIYSSRLLSLMGVAPDVLGLASPYLRILLITLPLNCGYGYLMMISRTFGDTRTPLQFMILCIVLDAVLNPLLIFGFGFLPALGVEGSAWASSLSVLVTLVIFLVYAVRRKHPLMPAAAELRWLNLKASTIVLLLRKGLPAGSQAVVMSSAALGLMVLVNEFGSSATAAYGAVSQLWSYVQMPAMALGAACSIMAAQNVGAGHWERVRRVTIVGLIFNLVLTGVPVALIYLFMKPCIGLFLPEGSASIALAEHLFLLATWSFVVSGSCFVLFGMMRAAGEVMVQLLVLIVTFWVIRFPFAWWGSRHFGLDAIWWSIPLGAILCSVFAAAAYRMTWWRMVQPRSFRLSMTKSLNEV